MAKAKHTINQHYIPQTYLKGFSSDSKHVYEFNLTKDAPIVKPVDISSICRDKYIYEVRDEHGELINPNYIENKLSEYERQFTEHRNLLLSKASIKENYQTRSFLSREEKNFWIFYAALNIMRNPITLNGMQKIFGDEFNGRLSEQEARNLAVAYCLPFFKEPDEHEMNAFVFFIQVLLQKVLIVGYSEEGNLFTSDHAMYGAANKKVIIFPQFGRLWFPITSNCGLIYCDPELTNRSNRNRLIPIFEDEVRELNKGIAYIASQMVLSKYPFSKEDIDLIQEARRERAEDDLNQTVLIN